MTKAARDGSASGGLEGRVAVVTGASRGIGRSTAVVLARAGAHVVAAARSRDALDALERSVRQEGGTLTAVACDVSSEEDVERLFAEADQAGGATVLVCAAGILGKGLLDEIGPDDWRSVLEVNLTGTFLCCRRAFRSMRGLGGGRILTIGSLAGLYGTEKFPGFVAYSVSKHGIVGLTEGLAVEGRPYGISAVCVSPGAVDTAMFRETNLDFRPGLGPDDVAGLIAGLLQQPMTPISGANIPLFSNR